MAQGGVKTTGVSTSFQSVNPIQPNEADQVRTNYDARCLIFPANF